MARWMDRAGSSGNGETLRRFRAGEPDEVRRVREYVGRIVSYQGYWVPAQEREDLEQEVMSQLYSALPTAEPASERRFWGLVRVITVRRCIDWLRSRRTEVPVDPSLRDGEPDPLERTLSRERRRRAAAVLAGLEKPCRELIHLRVGLGKSYAEVAELLGRSPGALRIQMYRCIRTLQSMLEEPAPGLEAVERE